MEVELNEEKLELKFTYKRMDDIEKEIGSLYSYPDRCGNKTVTIGNIVSIYYHAQENSSYNRGQIFDKVMTDGVVVHITRSYDVIMKTLFGDKVMEEVEKLGEEAQDSKKK